MGRKRSARGTDQNANSKVLIKQEVTIDDDEYGVDTNSQKTRMASSSSSRSRSRTRTRIPNTAEPRTSAPTTSIPSPITPSTSTPSVIVQSSSMPETSKNSKKGGKRGSRTETILKGLTDSLTTFYTPMAERRGTKQVLKVGGEVLYSSDEDDKQAVRRRIEEMRKKEHKKRKKKAETTQQPLSVDVDIELNSSSACSSSKSMNKLTDSLSPYFSAHSEKRRTVRKGEFLSLSGTRVYHKLGEFEQSDQSYASTSARESDSNSKSMSEKRRPNKTNDIGRVVGRRRTLNSCSAALFSTPDNDEKPIVQKRPRTPKEVFSPKVDRRNSASSRTPLLKSIKSEPVEGLSSDTEPAGASMAAAEVARQRKMKAKREKKSKRENGWQPENEAMENKENIVDDGSISINPDQRRMFEEVRRKVAEEIDRAESQASEYQEKADKEPRLPRAIRFGHYQIQTWYSSPYPMEYIHVPVLYMCDFCLKFVKTENNMIHHLRKCKAFHPPGTEIYRKDQLSVFEVDGNVEKTYCQNLCLLSKSFLDHKTLFYDVEPFLFYVVTTADSEGCHFVGYFSKEKYSMQKFNLSCIVTIPCYQKRGFGRFLIDFSFLLSRKEQMPGTPERPLSDLGRISYASYWRTALFEWIHQNVSLENMSRLSITDISKGTGISPYDIAEVFDSLGWFSTNSNGDNTLVIDFDMISAHWEKVTKDTSRIWIDEKCLKWTPKAFSPSKDNFRSPIRSPITPKKNTPSCSKNGGAATSTPSGVSLAAVGSTIKTGCGVTNRRRPPVGRNLSQKFSTENEPTTSGIEASKKKHEIENSTESETETSDDEHLFTKKDRRNRTRRKGCKEKTQRRPKKRDDSPDSEKRTNRRKSDNHRTAGSEFDVTLPSTSSITYRKPSTNHSGSKGRKNHRGKLMYEEDDDEKSTTSLASSSDSEFDLDEFETAQKGRKGKPQKGKVHPTQKQKRPPSKKGLTNGNTNGTTPTQKHLIPNGSPMSLKGSKILTAKLVNESAAMGVEDFVVRNAGPSNQSDRMLTPRNGDEAPQPPASDPNMGACPDASSATVTSDSNDESEASDVEIQREQSVDVNRPTQQNLAQDQQPATPMSSASDDSAATSRVPTPQPTGDVMVNMGFVSEDDEVMFGRHSAEIEGPPPLDLEVQNAQAPPPIDPPAVLEPDSSEEAPPMLAVQQMPTAEPHHPTMEESVFRDGYSTGDDDVPPQLSPNLGKTEQDELSEKEKILEAMDRPPMAPVAAGPAIDEEEKFYHQQLSANSHTVHMNANGIGSVGQPGSLGQPNSACPPNMMTPQHCYEPGSIQQATPGSAGVPSCGQMYNPNQTTPEQQIQQQNFMSPNIQPMPSSVSSVQSGHNNSMEMAGPSSMQQPQQQQQLTPQGPFGHEMMSQTTQQQSANDNGPAPQDSQMQHMPHCPPNPFSSPVNQMPPQQPPPSQQMNCNLPTSSAAASTSTTNHRNSENKKRQQHQNHRQAAASSAQDRMNFQMQQQMQHQMQFGHLGGYPPYPYSGYPMEMYAGWQGWQGAMFPQYYHGMGGPAAAMRMPPNMGAAAAVATTGAPGAWARYPNGTPAVNGQNAAANQFPHNAQSAFPQIPADISFYSNPFYMPKQ
ncbi:unnamed protein product [Caenorhabditis bovis]|uniref:histone acetyltransferase n=1 Tax=Caenorhabditis bovis TaxID=2654633 RepID=A0A8S1EC14_9PELO|nr:unnamed protein product [Caenorhabditis bovis]